MEIQHLSLKGSPDLEQFLAEWSASDNRDATFLQTPTTLYLMPYGHYASEKASIGSEKEKFSGSSRRHTYVRRDFEITDQILGGGYLRLSPDGKQCSYSGPSADFGEPKNIKSIVEAVNAKLLTSSSPRE